jgi:hypothetical protein
MPLILQGATSGSTTIQATDAVTQTITLPNNTGTVLTTASTFAGTGPAFSAYLGANQSASSGVFTKININTETFDTASCFDSTTNYRFTPNIAGYYQVNAVVRFSGTNLTEASPAIYKNGAAVFFGSYAVVTGQSVLISIATGLVYMNGTTDYLELYAYVVGTSPVFSFINAANTALFSASMVRSA